jgi:hypothetical protein
VYNNSGSKLDINLYDDERILRDKYIKPNSVTKVRIQVSNENNTQSMAYTLNKSLNSYQFIKEKNILTSKDI